jgi:hypothetical protein
LSLEYSNQESPPASFDPSAADPFRRALVGVTLVAGFVSAVQPVTTRAATVSAPAIALRVPIVRSLTLAERVRDGGHS